MKKLFLSLLILLPLYMAAEQEAVFKVVDQMPQFPGGIKALYNYLRASVRYPDQAARYGIEGRVITQFTVNTDGTITDIEIVRSGGDPSLDKEAVRVIKAMPKWIPGRSKGQPVRAKYSMPINFNMESSASPGHSEMAELPADLVKHLEKGAKAYEASIQKMAGFKDGESFYVDLEVKSKPVCAPNGIMISPNQGYVKVNMTTTSWLAMVRMQNDTMFVTYKDVKKDQVFKIERYLYDSAKDALSLDGEQAYVNNNAKYCSEIIANGKLKRTIWYDAQGQKERVYMYKAGTDISEIQLYPSGKTKIRTEHFGTPKAVRNVYDEEGNEAVLTEASCFSEMEQVVAKMLVRNKVYRNEDYRVAVTTSLDGENVQMLLCPKNFMHHRIWTPFQTDIYTPLDSAMSFNPATIGNVPVSHTFYMDLRYRPFEILLPTVDDSIIMKVFCTGSEKKIFSCLVCNNHYFAIADENAETQTVTRTQGNGRITNTYMSPKLFNAVIRRDGDTIFWNCDYEPVIKQCMVVNENGVGVLEGWQRYYKDGALDYDVLFHADTMAFFRKYYPDGSTHYEVTVSNREIREYFPTGELKMRETEDDNKEKHYTCYTKQGKEAETVMPAYPGGAYALKKYLKKNLDIKSVFAGHYGAHMKGWMDIFIEVDETGHLVDVQRGEFEMTGTIPQQKAREIFDKIDQCLRNNPTLCIPGTIDGEPQTMRTVIRLDNLNFH